MSKSFYLLLPLCLAGILLTILYGTPRALAKSEAAAAATPQLILDNKLFGSYFPPAIEIGSDDSVHVVYGDDKVYYAVRDKSVWQYQTVSAGAGWFAKIALDSQDTPHIVYVSEGEMGEGKIHYVTLLDSGRWHDEVILTVPESDPQPYDFVLDDADQPHIIWHNRYYYRNGEAWESIPFGDTYHATLAVDSTGTVYIAYTAYNGSLTRAAHIPSPIPVPSVLKVIRLQNENWETIYAEDLGELYDYQNVEIEVDGQDKPHLIYNTDTELRYLVQKTEGWETDLILDEIEPRKHTISLAIDQQDQPHVAFITRDGVYYGRVENNMWRTWLQVPDDNLAVGSYPVIALNNNRDVYIAHFIYVFADNKFTLNLNWWTGSEWAQTELAQTTRIGHDPTIGIAFDVHDQPHLSYHEVSRKIARPVGTQWLVQDTGLEDGSGSQYAYYEFDHHERLNQIEVTFDKTILHRVQIDGSWHTFTLTQRDDLNFGSVRFTADANDQLHLMYGYYIIEDFVIQDHILNYATFDGNSWITETVAAGTYEGYTHDLAVGPNGVPHIVAKLAISETIYQPLIRYYTLSDTVWVSETILLTDIYSFYTPPFIVVDSQNRPTIFPNTETIDSYFQWDGTQWMTYTLPFEGEFIADAVFDKKDNLHLIEDPFYTVRPDKLYAYQQGDMWITQTISSGESIGVWPPRVSLESNHHGEVYLLYVDPAGNQLYLQSPSAYTHTVPISAARGTLTYRFITAGFPPNTFTTTTDVTVEFFYTPRHIGSSYFGPGYQFEITVPAAAARAATPYTLTLAYDEAAVPPFNEADLALHHWTDGMWSAVPGTVDTTTNTLTAEVSEFGRYALLTAAHNHYLPFAAD